MGPSHSCRDGSGSGAPYLVTLGPGRQPKGPQEPREKIGMAVGHRKLTTEAGKEVVRDNRERSERTRTDGRRWKHRYYEISA